ncbi:S8 family serine peptidase [Thermus scotoductus]|uniref:S8 family serine peptidase n=1 Tax=Thermus scotoductus TaxID=37636 RepID=UPI0006920A6E|nr:S8 family serine peptidase [Thermus scotoductus]
MKRILPLLAGILVACTQAPLSPPTPSQTWVVGYSSQESLARLEKELGPPLTTEPALGLALFPVRPMGKEDIRFWEPLGAGERTRQPPARALSPQTTPNPLQWFLEAVRAPEAWASSQGEGVMIALLDDWPDPGHPALQDRLLPGYDPVSDTPIPLPGPTPDPHATAVAALLAGQGPLYGLAPKARILPVRLFQPEYPGDFYAARAIRYAVDAGAKVLSLSWGGLGYSQALYDAVVYALERGVSLVAAAGNLGLTLPYYPAAYPGVVGVWSTDPSDQPSSFSNRGPWFTLGAPGERILTAIPGGGGAFMDGTSFATPLVAGALALVQAQENRGPFPLRWALKSQGQLDAEALLQAPFDRYGFGACLQLRVFRPDPESPVGRSPVAQAEVALEGPEVLRLLTDSQGRARVYQVAPGTYRLRVSGLGSAGWVQVEETLSLSYACTVEHFVLLP